MAMENGNSAKHSAKKIFQEQHSGTDDKCHDKKQPHSQVGLPAEHFAHRETGSRIAGGAQRLLLVQAALK